MTDGRDGAVDATSDAADLARIGVLGGMSGESTREYYRRIDAGVNDALGGHHAADLVIRSVDFADVERFVRTADWAAAGAYLAEAAADLEAAGAAFVVLATNTMHRVAPAVEAAVSIPLVHVVDVVADAAVDRGLDAVGLLGTRRTMEAAFYRDRLAERGVDTLVPAPETRAAVDEVIFEELTRGVVEPDSRALLLDAVDDLVAAGADGVVLGCTELEMLVDEGDREAAILDSTALHAARAVELSLRGPD